MGLQKPLPQPFYQIYVGQEHNGTFVWIHISCNYICWGMPMKANMKIKHIKHSIIVYDEILNKHSTINVCTHKGIGSDPQIPWLYEISPVGRKRLSSSNSRQYDTDVNCSEPLVECKTYFVSYCPFSPRPRNNSFVNVPTLAVIVFSF